MAQISKFDSFYSGTRSELDCQDFYTKNKKVARDGIALAAASGDFKASADVTAVIDNCREVSHGEESQPT